MKEVDLATQTLFAELLQRSLAEAWKTAWNMGKEWRRKLESGRVRLPSEAQEIIKSTAEAK